MMHYAYDDAVGLGDNAPPTTTRCLCMQGRCVGQWSLSDAFYCARVCDLAHGIPPEVAQHAALARDIKTLRSQNTRLVDALRELYSMGEYQRTVSVNSHGKLVGNAYAQARALLAEIAEGKS